MPRTYPDACKSCGLYLTCNTWKLPMEQTQKKVDLLLVLRTPEREDDGTGMIMQGEGGQFIREVLGFWEGSWAATHVVKCLPPNYARPTDAQIGLCADFLEDEIFRTSPKVIITFGSEAMQALWPEGMTMTRARTNPTQFGDGAWLLATYHPNIMRARGSGIGREELLDEYLRVFGLAHQIIQGQFRQHRPDIRIVKTEDDLAEVTKQVLRASHITLDVETNTHKDVPGKECIYKKDAKLLCLGLGTSPKEPVWVLPRKYLTKSHLACLTGKTLVAHNGKFDLQALDHFVWRGIWDATDLEDTLLMKTSQDLGKANNGLKQVAMDRYAVPDWSEEIHAEVERCNQIFEREWAEDNKSAGRRFRRDWEGEAKIATFEDVPFQMLAEYNGRDVYFTMLLHQDLLKEEEQGKIPSVYRDRLLGATKALAQVERNGVPMNMRRLAATRKAYEKKAEEMIALLRAAPEVQRVEMARARKNAEKTKKGTLKPYAFNVNSWIDQVALLEATGLELDEEQVTETGRPKLDKKVLAELGKLNKLWKYVAMAKSSKQMISKFIKPLEKFACPDGRVRATYKVAKVEVSGHSAGSDESGGTETGRIAASDPALHNIKKRGDGNIIRNVFEAPPGHVFVEWDYSQAEVRMLAVMANVQRLKEIFWEGRDPYKQSACDVEGFHYDDVPDTVRDKWKAGVLSTIYRIGLASFCEKNNLTEKQGRQFLRQFQGQFPEIIPYQEDFLIPYARAGNPIKLGFGRYRTFGPYPQNWKSKCKAIDRELCNCVIQNPTSDIVVLFKLPETIERWKNIKVEVSNPVHDALWALVPERHLKEVVPEQIKLMENMKNIPPLYGPDGKIIGKIDVPMAVDAKVGRTLGDMVKWSDWKQGIRSNRGLGKVS